MTGENARTSRIVAGLILGWFAAHWAAVASAPLLSEAWTHLDLVSTYANVADCFDRSHPPPRPLQHIYFLAALKISAPPWLMRLVPFALHAGSAAVLARLAARAGLSRGACLAAGALFALYPCARAVAWTAAVSGPGHVFFELLALLAFASRPERRISAAALASLWLALALSFHPSAALAPLYMIAWRILVSPGSGPRAAFGACLRDPAIWASILISALALAWILPAPGPRGGVRELGAVLANTARGSVFFLPEPLRVAVVEGIRSGAARAVPGLSALVAIAGAAAWAWFRGGPLFRFALVVAAADLGLAAAKAGYSLRYAILPSAALALALSSLAARGRNWAALVVAFGLSFASDSIRDTADFAEAGRRAEALLDAAVSAQRKLGPDTVLWIVDPPPEHGRERDIPVWNWGIRQALAARAVTHVKPVTRLRSTTSGTDVDRVGEPFLEKLLADRSLAILRCHPDGSVEFLEPGRAGR